MVWALSPFMQGLASATARPCPRVRCPQRVGSAGPACAAAALAVQARVSFQGGGAEGLKAGQQFPEPAGLCAPGMAVVALLGAEAPADGPARRLAGPPPRPAPPPGPVR